MLTAALVGVVVHRGPATHRFVPHGRLVLDEEFRGAHLDRSRWSTCYDWERAGLCTNSGNRELEVFTPRNVSVAAGQLRLTADRAVSSVDDYRMGWLRLPYTSGMVSTGAGTFHWRPKFSYLYGCLEVRASFPAGAGLWPAIWLDPADNQWPPEVDVVEVYGQRPEAAYLTDIYGAREGERTGRRWRGLTPGMHTYDLTWTPNRLTWYVDGITRFVVTGRALVPHVPMKIVIDLAVSSRKTAAPPGPSTRMPASLDVAYVRVWQ